MTPFVLVCFLAVIPFVVPERPTVCPYGYNQIDRKCYKILNLSLTFFEAVTACDVIDGKLAEVTTARDNVAVSTFIVSSKPSVSGLWMGATNLQGKWMYMSSKNMNAMDTFTSWAPGYPVPATKEDGNNCAAITQTSSWNWENVPCSFHQGALCYVELREEDPNETIIG